jgi:hypothetical protein
MQALLQSPWVLSKWKSSPGSLSIIVPKMSKKKSGADTTSPHQLPQRGRAVKQLALSGVPVTGMASFFTEIFYACSRLQLFP